MKTLLLLLAIVVLTGCPDITRPPQRCYWKYTAFGLQTDTVWNTIPGGSPPFILVTRTMPTDSVRVCP